MKTTDKDYANTMARLYDITATQPQRRETTEAQERAHLAALAGIAVGLLPGRVEQADALQRHMHAEVNRLRTIIDSRPAINAGLPATYIEWSQSIYEMDMAHAIANVKGGFQ